MRVLRAFALPLLLVAGVPAAAQEGEPPHTLGACGGVMTGYDGRQYVCEPDRRPACDENSSRCVCLEQTACGGKRNEPF